MNSNLWVYLSCFLTSFIAFIAFILVELELRFNYRNRRYLGGKGNNIF